MVNGQKTFDILSQFDESFKDEWGRWTHKKVSIDGIECTAFKAAFTGEVGMELHCEYSNINKVYNSIKSLNVKNFGSLAMNILRSEKGIPLAGKDFTKDHNPIGANLGRFIKTKKDFIGKESYLRLKEEYKNNPDN